MTPPITTSKPIPTAIESSTSPITTTFESSTSSTVTVTTTTSLSCTDDWMVYNNACYKYFSDQKTWQDAARSCRTFLVKHFKIFCKNYLLVNFYSQT